MLPTGPRPRLFVSAPDDRHLDPSRLELKQRILQAIAAQGFELAGFEPEQFGVDLPRQPEAWTVDGALRRLRRCDGVVVLGLARALGHWQSPARAQQDGATVAAALASPYNHLEGALALALDLPTLLLQEEGMDLTGIFNSGVKPLPIPVQGAAPWLCSDGFRRDLAAWRAVFNDRCKVFLGYCSAASPVAEALRTHLEAAGHPVLDWARDFHKAGATILDEIERASACCRSAVLLFTRDDELAECPSAPAAPRLAAPRDNVVLEAGYFLRSHGQARVAIVRERGAKVPADLGGVILLEFDDRQNLESLQQQLVRHLDQLHRAADGASAWPHRMR